MKNKKGWGLSFGRNPLESLTPTPLSPPPSLSLLTACALPLALLYCALQGCKYLLDKTK